MKRRFDVTPMIRKEGKAVKYWTARIYYNTVATVQSGEMGKPGRVEKIKTDLFNPVDKVIESLKEQKLKEGYSEVLKEDLEALVVLVSPGNEHHFENEFFPEDIDDELDQLNDDINDFLLERGLSASHCTCFMEDRNIILKYYVLDREPAKKMIEEAYGERISLVKQKIENWSG